MINSTYILNILINININNNINNLNIINNLILFNRLNKLFCITIFCFVSQKKRKIFFVEENI